MKLKATLLAAVLLSSLSYAMSQDLNFSDLADLPSARSALASANDGSHIYVVNGLGPDTPHATEIFKYDIAADSWSLLATSEFSKRFASCAIVENQLYIFNGELGIGILNPYVEKVNLEDGTIEVIGPNPQPVRSAGAASWNDKVYSFGGYIGPGSYSDAVLEFDPQTMTWNTVTQLPVATETEGAIIDGKLYIIGGFNGDVSDRIYIYDIEADSWSNEVEMPSGLSAHATAKIGNRIYLVGDFTNLNTLSYFDTSDNNFYMLSSNLNPRRHCAAEGIDGRLYAIGGNTNSSIQSAIASTQAASVLTNNRDITTYEWFKVYPNPTNDWLYLDQPFKWIRIIDVSGKTVQTIPAQTAAVRVANLNRGTYLLTGEREDRLYVAKWVKQ